VDAFHRISPGAASPIIPREDAKLSIIAQNQRLGDNFTALPQRSTPVAFAGPSASYPAPKGNDCIAFRAASGFRAA
jgi:hypothetical protein